MPIIVPAPARMEGFRQHLPNQPPCAAAERCAQRELPFTQRWTCRRLATFAHALRSRQIDATGAGSTCAMRYR